MAILIRKGGAGSGNFGHVGRPGKVGGSAKRNTDSVAMSDNEVLSILKFLYFTKGDTSGRHKAFVQKEFGVSLPDKITLYHITDARNGEAIIQKGLQAKSSDMGTFSRNPAVYFFMSKSDLTTENADLLGIDNPLVVVTDVPTAKALDNLHVDGLFGGFETSFSAVAYDGDIPADWIRVSRNF